MKPKKVKIIALFLFIFMGVSISVNAFEPYFYNKTIVTDRSDGSHSCSHSNSHRDHDAEPFMHLFDGCCCGVTTSLFNVSEVLLFDSFHSTYNIPRNCFFNSLDISSIDEPPQS